MMQTDLDEWAKEFASDLGSDNARVPFDRVISRHRLRLDGFIAHGLTYATLAKAITRAGGRRPDGTPYSDKQFNSALRRAQRSARDADAPSPPPPSPASKPTPRHPPNNALRRRMDRAPQKPVVPPATPPATALHPPPSNSAFIRPTDQDRDLSDEDIRAALLRIRRADP
ncbi:hypothetical protein [Methylobacterium sp.]|uniref:hypothetical protein n=1 Tax=Methylobacterium sp. TaxID=409 RepID=UPI003B001D43